MGSDKLCDFCIHRHGSNPTCFPSKNIDDKNKCPVRICTDRMMAYLRSHKNRC